MNSPNNTPEIFELLPEYALDLLSEADKMRVDNWLKENPELRSQAESEITWWQQSSSQLKQTHHTQSVPSDRMLASLQQKIQADIQVQPSESTVSQTHPTDSKPGFMAQIRQFFESYFSPYKGAIAFGFAAIAFGQFLHINNLNKQLTNVSTQVILSGENTATDQGPVYNLEFADDATVQDINEILTEVNANIISGPSALGMYRVELPTDATDASVALLTHHEITARLSKQNN